MWKRAVFAGAVAVLSPLIAAVPAWAAHPGTNGLIAFVRVIDTHSHLFTISPDGTGEQQLTFATNGSDYAPDWSPDGTEIAFERRLASGRYQIFVITPGGGEPAVNISNSPTNDTSPSWGPNGRRIAFARDGHIWKMHADGTVQQQITHRPYTDGDPSWSSTGDLAFVRCCPPGWDESIYVRRSGSRTATRLLGERYDPDGSDSYFNPDWSPEGAKLAYTVFGGYSDGGDFLNGQTVDGGSYTGFGMYCDYCDPSDPAWSPDGTLAASDISNNPDDQQLGIYVGSSCGCGDAPPPEFLTAGTDPAWQPVPPS